MNSKLFILGVIALNCNIIWAQLAIHRGHAPAFIGSSVLHANRGHGLVSTGPALHVGHGLRAAHLAAPAFALGGHAIGVSHAPAIRVAAPVGLALGGIAHAGIAHAPVGLAYGGYGGLGLRHASVGHVQHIGPISAAIHTRRTHQVIDVPTSQDVIQPQTLIVEPNILPVNIEFRSQSSPVNVNQVHIPGQPGHHEATRSEEEPDRLVHEVVKPVIQEVRETIVPFRRITQEILPVQEEVNTVVARGQRNQVIAQPQIVAQPVVAAQRVAVAAPAIAVAQPALQAIRVVAAQPAFARVAVAAQPTFAIANQGIANGGLITTGISRFGGVIGNGGLFTNGGLIANGGLISRS